MYDFIVIGQKDDDCYVIQDMREGMGGKCSVSRYTLLQLFDLGFRILGIQPKNGKLGVHDVVCYNVTGERSTRINSYPSVEDIKRSASTVSKGLKLSRAEKKQRKETSEKRVKTLQTNKKEAERVAKEKEKLEKQAEKTKLQYQKYLESLKRTKQKSKPNMVLVSMKGKASEYHLEEIYRYRVEMYSPAAITAFMKGLHSGLYHLTFRHLNDTVDARSLNRELERRGCARVEVEVKHSLDEWKKDFNIVSDSSVSYDFENTYQGYSFSCVFVGVTKEVSRLNCYHIEEEWLREGFGSTAGHEYDLNSLRKYLMNLGHF